MTPCVKTFGGFFQDFLAAGAGDVAARPYRTNGRRLE